MNNVKVYELRVLIRWHRTRTRKGERERPVKRVWVYDQGEPVVSYK